MKPGKFKQFGQKICFVSAKNEDMRLYLNKIKRIVKNILPEYLYNLLLKTKLRKFKHLSLEQTFTKIYREKLWSSQKNQEFSSGGGTYDKMSIKYIDLVSRYIKNNRIKSIVDIGCGDFFVMRSIIENTKINYIGCDIVEELINFNNKMFARENIKFIKLDAVSEPLPDAEMCCVRQVLQHLDNKQISMIIDKLKKYKVVLITEHIPSLNKVHPNIDKTAGPDIRLYYNSGVYIDKYPFNLDTQIVLEYKSDFKIQNRIIPAILRTSLLKNNI